MDTLLAEFQSFPIIVQNMFKLTDFQRRQKGFDINHFQTSCFISLTHTGSSYFIPFTTLKKIIQKHIQFLQNILVRIRKTHQEVDYLGDYQGFYNCDLSKKA